MLSWWVLNFHGLVIRGRLRYGQRILLVGHEIELLLVLVGVVQLVLLQLFKPLPRGSVILGLVLLHLKGVLALRVLFPEGPAVRLTLVKLLVLLEKCALGLLLILVVAEDVIDALLLLGLFLLLTQGAPPLLALFSLPLVGILAPLRVHDLVDLGVLLALIVLVVPLPLFSGFLTQELIVLLGLLFLVLGQLPENLLLLFELSLLLELRLSPLLLLAEPPLLLPQRYLPVLLQNLVRALDPQHVLVFLILLRLSLVDERVLSDDLLHLLAMVLVDLESIHLLVCNLATDAHLVLDRRDLPLFLHLE